MNQTVADPVDQIPCCLLSCSLDGKITSANSLLIETTGFSHAELIGEPLKRVVGMAGYVLYQSYLLPLLKTHRSVQGVKLDLRLASGKYISCTIGAILLQPSDGGEVRMAIMPTERQAEIADELTRIRRAAEQVPGTLFQLVVPKHGSPHLPYVSESVRQMYGTTPALARESIDALFFQVLPEDRAFLRHALLHPLKLDSDWTHTFRVKRVDEAERWHELTARSNVTADGGVVWHGYIADVSERKQSETLSASLEAARMASAAKSTFLARISHELRTPLNAIIGFSDLLHRAPSIQQDEKIRTRLGFVSDAGRHLLAMVNDLLDIGRVESGNMQMTSISVNVSELIRECVENAQSAAQTRDVTIEILAPSQPAYAKGDPTRIRQIITNLLSNAIKYNRLGGVVRIAMGVDATRTTIAISDGGLGLTPVQIANLFQPFNRLGADRGAVEGIGLGLVISKQLAEAMGGWIQIASQIGVGSTFTLQLVHAEELAVGETFLAVAPKRDANIAAIAPPASEPKRPFSLLYIDDEQTNIELMRQALESHLHIELLVASDGMRGIRLAEIHQPTIILLDIGMPVMDGFQVFTALKNLERTAVIPVVACSANAMAADIDKARAHGFAGYITKPLNVSALVDNIEAFLPDR